MVFKYELNMTQISITAVLQVDHYSGTRSEKNKFLFARKTCITENIIEVFEIGFFSHLMNSVCFFAFFFSVQSEYLTTAEQH